MSLSTLIKRFPHGLDDKGWDFRILTMNRNISSQFIQDNPQYPWSHSSRMEDGDDILINCSDHRNYLHIPMTPQQALKWFLHGLSKNSHQQIEYVRSFNKSRFIELIDSNFIDEIDHDVLPMLDWSLICENIPLTKEFIIKYSDYIMVEYLSYNKTLTVDIYNHIASLLGNSVTFGNIRIEKRRFVPNYDGPAHRGFRMGALMKNIRDLTTEFIDDILIDCPDALKWIGYNPEFNWSLMDHIIKKTGNKYLGILLKESNLPLTFEKVGAYLHIIKGNLRGIDLNRMDWKLIIHLKNDINEHIWSYIYHKVPINEEAIINLHSKMKREWLSRNPGLTIDLIEFYDSLVKNDKTGWDWSDISCHISGTTEQLEKYKNKFNMHNLSENENIPYQFIASHKDWKWNKIYLNLRSYSKKCKNE